MFPKRFSLHIVTGLILLLSSVPRSAAQTTPALGSWDLRVGPMRGELIFVTSQDVYLDLNLPDGKVITEIFSYAVDRDGTISLNGREIHAEFEGLSPNKFRGKLSANGEYIGDLRNLRDTRGNVATATWRNFTIPEGWQKHSTNLSSDRARLYQLLSQNYSIDGRKVVVGFNPEFMSRLEESRDPHHRKLAIAYQQLVAHLDSFQGPELMTRVQAETKLVTELRLFAAGINSLPGTMRELMNSDIVQKPLEWRAIKVRHLALSHIVIAAMTAEVRNQYSDRGKEQSRLALSAAVNENNRIIVSVKNPLPRAVTNAYIVFTTNYDGKFLDAAVRNANAVEYEPLVLALGVNLSKQTEAMKATTDLCRASPQTPIFVPYLAAGSTISTELPGPTGVPGAVETIDVWFGSDQVTGTGRIAKSQIKRGRSR